MRISSRYTPGCGDRGISNLGRQNIKKGDTLNFFYGVAESAQLSTTDVLLTSEAYNQQEVYSITRWLSQAVPAISAFYYHLVKGKLDSLEKFNFKSEHFEKMNNLIAKWQPQYGDSLDFQIFYDEKLHNLNKVRVAIRDVEQHFFFALLDSRVLYRYHSKESISEEADKMGAGLNRLSSLYWLLTLREQNLSEIKPVYWVGSMPKLEL